MSQYTVVNIYPAAGDPATVMTEIKFKFDDNREVTVTIPHGKNDSVPTMAATIDKRGKSEWLYLLATDAAVAAVATLNAQYKGNTYSFSQT